VERISDLGCDPDDDNSARASPLTARALLLPEMACSPLYGILLAIDKMDIVHRTLLGAINLRRLGHNGRPCRCV
jgi:hypothetical protein